MHWRAKLPHPGIPSQPPGLYMYAHQEGIALLASITVRMSISGEMLSALLRMCR